MKPSFILFALADLLLLGLTTIMGLTVGDKHDFFRHFLLGMLSGLFTCFVHIVLFMYFVVQGKIMQQAHLSDGLAIGFCTRTNAIKSRAVRAAMGGICIILLTVGLGAAIGVLVRPEIHMIAAFACVAANGAIFLYQYTLLDQYADVFHEAFPEG